SGSRLAKARGGGKHAEPEGSAAGRARGGRAPHPSQVHDGGHHVHGPGADPLVHRRGRGSDEADRGPDGGRPGELLPDGTDRVSGAVRALEVARIASGEGDVSRVVPQPFTDSGTRGGSVSGTRFVVWPRAP